MKAEKKPCPQDVVELCEDLKKWFEEFEQWGQRVRDDIMALEDAVIDMAEGRTDDMQKRRPFGRAVGREKRYKQVHPGGDPGDPPEGPFDS